MAGRDKKSVFEAALDPDPATKAIGVFFSSLFAGALIMAAAPVAIQAYKEWKKRQKK